MKRALIFLAITFGITYAYDFLVVYPIAQGSAPYASEFLSPGLAYMVAVALTMFFPALGVVLTRLVTREELRRREKAGTLRIPEAALPDGAHRSRR